MDIKPLDRLTETLRLLLKINIAIAVAAVFAGIYDCHSYANLPSGFDPNETILPCDVVTAIVGLTQFVFLIIVGVTFLRWIHRTNKNLHALAGEQMTFTPGWSVGWYFIPIANLFKPYQGMKEIWQISHKNRAAALTVVGWWWALWLISNFLGQLAFRLAVRTEDAAGYNASSIAFILSDGLDVMLSIVALMLVTRIWVAYSENILEEGASTDGEFAALRPQL
jgi:hypothetical protein